MYISTRGNYEAVSAAEAILLGMVPAGGLFVPQDLPSITKDQLKELVGKAYQQVARFLLPLFLEGFTQEEIDFCIEKAYNHKNFYHPQLAPLHKMEDNIFFLELWHGPTAAFKDMALQIIPYFLSLAKKKAGEEKETVILVATSGDTGKAALEGFKDVQGIKIVVFYPYQGVSQIQELQMVTTDGSNTFVVAVEGNFDDCQNAVKTIFKDANFKSKLQEAGFKLSSANSINWGRLLPQIVYYFWAYLRLIAEGEISWGEEINFVVPTGNFGNILAAWYASSMGLPVYKLICASNENKVLTDFFNTGKYDRNRPFKQTNSPSMDILISSNLERFLFEVSGHDAGRVGEWMEKLQQTGCFSVDPLLKEKMLGIIAPGFATEEDTLQTIKDTYFEKGYTIDTHTAVGLKVYREYSSMTGDKRKTVIAATASPFKFASSVLEAIKGGDFIRGKNELLILKELSEISKMPVHPALRDLEQKKVRHRTLCKREEIREQVEHILQL
ncbi:MAG: threonine synthase [Firmicutes bacterium]|nr:threonine synthase [Bacillota bacterium]